MLFKVLHTNYAIIQNRRIWKMNSSSRIVLDGVFSDLIVIFVSFFLNTLVFAMNYFSFLCIKAGDFLLAHSLEPAQSESLDESVARRLSSYLQCHGCDWSRSIAAAINILPANISDHRIWEKITFMVPISPPSSRNWNTSLPSPFDLWMGSNDTA